ncbi:hypothetical protein Aduo_002329 [Ancylostoma duodenale]
MKLSKSIVTVKWYRKETSKNILIHASSAHPVAMKRAVIRNMFRTAIDVCTGEVERSRKALEAFWIAARNPKMNNRNECLSITSDFLPYISLCEL